MRRKAQTLGVGLEAVVRPGFRAGLEFRAPSSSGEAKCEVVLDNATFVEADRELQRGKTSTVPPRFRMRSRPLRTASEPLK